jgi:hypothetical protein
MKSLTVHRFAACLVLIIGSCWSAIIFGQGEAAKEPRKLDSYGDLIADDELAHLDNLIVTLGNEPGAQAYVIVYGGREDPPGKARRLSLRVKYYLTEMRGIDPKRVVAIAGGYREESITELWIVPAGARSPVPTPTVSVKDDLGDNLLYDEYGTGGEFVMIEDDTSRLDGFAEVLKKEPRSWGCIIAYAQNGDDRMGMEWDLPGTALKAARSERNYLIKKYHFAPSRITAVDGGYSKGRTEGLWIMRPGARYDNGPFIYSGRLKVGKHGSLSTSGYNKRGICCKACTHGHRDAYLLKGARRPY